jgi:hypothetical protein
MQKCTVPLDFKVRAVVHTLQIPAATSALRIATFRLEMTLSPSRVAGMSMGSPTAAPALTSQSGGSQDPPRLLASLSEARHPVEWRMSLQST